MSFPSPCEGEGLEVRCKDKFFAPIPTFCLFFESSQYINLFPAMPSLRYKPSWLLLAGVLLLDGCNQRRVSPAPDPNDLREVYRPIYSSYDAVRNIQTQAPRAIRQAGKIYIKDGFLFVNEVGQGIHIVDNRNPEKPVKLSFVSIPGSRELAIKDSILYADNTIDLVALNVANPQNVRVVKRIQNAYPITAYPPMRNVRFECPDSDKGLVVGWQKSDNKDVNCWR